MKEILFISCSNDYSQAKHSDLDEIGIHDAEFFIAEIEVKTWRLLFEE
jgi:hypothetical protein